MPNNIPEHFYQEVSGSIKLVFDLTSRIDERVKMLVEQHNESSHRIERLMERHESLTNRIGFLENKIGIIENKISHQVDLEEELQDLKESYQILAIKSASFEIHNVGQDNKWKLIGDFVFKIIIMTIGSIIAWKFST